MQANNADRQRSKLKSKAWATDMMIISVDPNDRNREYLSVRRVCDALGIDVDSQRKKRREKTWATTVINTVVDSNGRNRGHFMVNLNSFPMWLATIDTNRVAKIRKEDK